MLRLNSADALASSGVILILSSIVSGFIAGFIGAGNGLVLVPVLIMYFHQFLHLNVYDSALYATNTSIAIMLFTSIFNYIIRQSNKDKVQLFFLLKCISILLCTSVFGVLIKNKINHTVYIAFMSLILAYYGIRSIKHAKKPPIQQQISRIKFFLEFSFIAIFSVFAGTGTGKIIIPLLKKNGFDRNSSIKFAKIIAVWNCLFITLVNMFYSKNNTLPGFIGSIYYYAVLIMVISSIYPMYLGIKYSDKFHNHTHDIVFGIFLIISSITLLKFQVSL